MQVLQADPLTFLGGLLYGLDRDFVLATTHRNLVVGGTTHSRFCVCNQLFRRIRAW